MVSDEFAGKIYKAVGEKLAGVRRGMPTHPTQEELASRTGHRLSRSAIANIERGRQRLAVHQLYLIAQALGTTPETLLPPLESILGTHGEVPENRNVRAWLSKVRRKPLGKEVDPNAKAKPD